MRMGLKGKTGALPPSCQKDEPSLDFLVDVDMDVDERGAGPCECE